MNAPGPIPEPEVLIRKVKVKGHAAAHGGGWKIAYADFVTAMMAFFMVMWLLGTTDDDQRKGIADYFAPPSTIKSETPSGGTGVMGGQAPLSPDGEAATAERSMIKLDAVPARTDTQQAIPADIETTIREKMRHDPALGDLERMLHFTETPEGLRIELIDDADYSMFVNSGTTIDPRAELLLTVVAESIRGLPNKLAIRGHTDARPFTTNRGYGNNWALSAARAEATRKTLAAAGVAPERFSRLEGVADTEPSIADDPFDPRNRRMSVTLLRG